MRDHQAFHQVGVTWERMLAVGGPFELNPSFEFRIEYLSFCHSGPLPWNVPHP
jgi:hypothetical protein